jgi:hypothetical protein
MKSKNQSHWILKEIAEESAPRTTINQWSQIEARLVSSPGENRLKMIARLYTSAYILVTAVLILLAAIVLAVPQARASIKEVIQRMGMELVQPNPDSEGAVASVEPIRITPPPSMTLEEIQKQFPYKLLVPTWLPGDLSLFHADVIQSTSDENTPGSPCVRLSYRPTGAPLDDPRHISFKVSLGEECGGPFLLPATKEQAVEVNGQPGSFVQGGWRSDGKGDPETTYAHLQWDDSLGDAYLAWEQEGLNYFIAAFELGLTREEMIRIAKSIREPW